MQAISKAGIKHRLKIANRLDSSHTLGCDQCGTLILSNKGQITNLPATVSTVQHCHLLEERAKLSVIPIECTTCCRSLWDCRKFHLFGIPNESETTGDPIPSDLIQR